MNIEELYLERIRVKRSHDCRYNQVSYDNNCLVGYRDCVFGLA